LILDMPDLPDF